jgi:predicted RNase H-like nuclease (RuvC/YqgF family)
MVRRRRISDVLREGLQSDDRPEAPPTAPEPTPVGEATTDLSQNSAELEDLQGQLHQERQRSEQLQGQLQSQQQEIQVLTQALQEAEKTQANLAQSQAVVQKLQAQIQYLEGNLAQQQHLIGQLESQVETLQALADTPSTVTTLVSKALIKRYIGPVQQFAVLSNDDIGWFD